MREDPVSRSPVHVFVVSNDVWNDRRVLRIASTLQKSGCEVLLIGRSLGRKPDKDCEVAVHHVRCWVNSGPVFYLELTFRMIFFLRRAHFETLTCADLDTILVGYFFKLFRKYKLFFDAHELFTDVPELKGAGLKRYIWRMVGRLGVSETDSCYTVNHSLQTILEKRFGKKFEVIPNVPSATGVNKSGAREKGPFKLVYLGVLNPGRGLPELIEAISQLEAVQCLVIGDGPERKRLEELANNAPGGGQIQFLGMIPPSEISELMIGCHLGVNLLDGTSPSYYYSLANKFFDYIHAGLPVLTMDYPEYARVNERFACCVLIKSLDTSEIMSAINGLSIDDAGYRQLCHAAHAAAAYYTWEKIEPRLLEMYRL